MSASIYRQAGRVRAMWAGVPADFADLVTARLRDDSAVDVRAMECIARIEAAKDRGSRADLYAVGCAVSDYLGISDDYQHREFASRFGAALGRARTASVGFRPVTDDGDRPAWRDVDVQAVAIAVQLLPTLVQPGDTR